MNILDFYVMKPPGHQNAVDLFEGTWSSRLPAEVESGGLGLFNDPRIPMIAGAVGGLEGKNVLELGPLEAAHTHMMLESGAASVTAIEANSKAYLKCLITKEIMGMSGASFLLGDFDPYLEDGRRFDMILACGVIYHCKNPVRTITNLSRTADAIGIWSHYYEEQRVRKLYGRKFRHSGETMRHEGYSATCYQLSYGTGLRKKGFCGGGNPTTQWMDRPSWLKLWDDLGFDFEILDEDPMAANGPAFTAVARKRAG